MRSTSPSTLMRVRSRDVVDVDESFGAASRSFIIGSRLCPRRSAGPPPVVLQQGDGLVDTRGPLVLEGGRNLHCYFTAETSTVRMSGALASNSSATSPSATGICPPRWACRPSSSSKVSKIPY